MINLLSNNYQKDLRAAYSNTLLLRYLILLIVALLFLAIFFVISYFYLQSQGVNADNIKQDNEQKAASFAQVNTNASQLRTQLSEAKVIFDDDIQYSKVLMRLKELLPVGTALNGLELSKDSFGNPITIPILVRGENEANQLLANFSNSAYISAASLGGVATVTDAPFPYTVDLNFTMDKGIAQ